MCLQVSQLVLLLACLMAACDAARYDRNIRRACLEECRNMLQKCLVTCFGKKSNESNECFDVYSRCESACEKVYSDNVGGP